MTVHKFSAMTMGVTLLLLIAGGLVTSTDAGLSVPDWPLSYGTLFPPMVGGIRFEHTHRLIAAVVALMILALTVWLWRVEPRRWVRWLGTSALLAVIVQALLGGLTVLWGLPPAVSIAHACLGQLVFCLVACVMLVTSAKWDALRAASVQASGPALRWLALATALVLFVQLVLGALLRHAGTMLLAHLGGALLIVGLVVVTLRRLMRTPQLPASPRRIALVLAGMVGVQIVLGLVALLHRDQALLTTAHQVVGAMILAHGGFLVMIIWRVTRTA